MRIVLLALAVALTSTCVAQERVSRPGTFHLVDGTTLRFDYVGFIESPNQKTFGIELVENSDTTLVPLWHFSRVEFQGPSGSTASVTTMDGGTRRVDSFVVGTPPCPRSVMYMPFNHVANKQPFGCLESFRDIRSIEFDDVFGWIAVDPKTNLQFPAQYRFNPASGDSLILRLEISKPDWWPTPTLKPIK